MSDMIAWIAAEGNGRGQKRTQDFRGGAGRRRRRLKCQCKNCRRISLGPVRPHQCRGKHEGCGAFRGGGAEGGADGGCLR